MTEQEKQAQVQRLCNAEKLLGVKDVKTMVAMLGGVDYDTYGKWRRGDRLMNAGAKSAIDMLLCMLVAKDLAIPALDVWQQVCDGDLNLDDYLKLDESRKVHQ